MKLKERYIRTWIYTSIFMFGLSYLWHGVFLNDLSKVSYSHTLFYGLAAIAYLLMGLALTLITIKTSFFSKKYINGTFVGGLFGFFLYLVAFVLGVSFVTGNSLEHAAIDFMWQTIEQGAGGFVAGALYNVYKDMAKIKSIEKTA